MSHGDSHSMNLRRLGTLSVAFVFVAACSPSSNRISSPRLRGAAAAKPCPNSANNSTTQPVNDGSALALVLAPESSPSIRKAGGYILTEGFGIKAGLESQKSRVTYSSGDEAQLGNPKGIMDVLNIPACTEPRPSIDERTLRRCVSRLSWEELNLPSEQATLSKILSSPWEPRKTFKQCTASVTIDGHDFGDLLSSNRSSGIQRIRVWTAEHCYQSSYAQNVHLLLPTADLPELKDIRTRYLSVPLTQVDGIEFSRAMIAKNGGGGMAADSNLATKMFLLRSMDGRTSQSYADAVVKGCLLRQRELGAESPFAKSKFVDCFTTADLATFKASINLADLSGNPLRESVSGTSLADARRVLVRDILQKEKKRYDALQNAASPMVQGLLSVLKVSADFFGFGELFISQMDGIAHSRRVESMLHEQQEFSISTLADLGSFAPDFRMYQYDASNVNYFELGFKLLRTLGPNTADLGCSLLSVIPGLPVCPAYVMSPLHTVELESRYYQPIRDLKTYMKLMLGKLIVTSLNPQMSDSHPLKIKPADDEVVVSTKMGAIWTRLSFESALMRAEPFAEVPAYNSLGKAFQQLLKVTCPSAEFANQLVPVFLNRRDKVGQSVFASFGLLGPGTLKIMPIVGTDVGDTAGFRTDVCGGGRASVVPGLGAFVPRGGVALPLESTVAIDVDDKLLCLPVDGNENLECSAEGRRNAAINYMGRRVVYKFEGAEPNPANVVGPTDSGTLWTLLGLPAFALTSHNGDLVNGVVFDQIPDINTIDPDRTAPATDAQGNPIGTCN